MWCLIIVNVSPIMSIENVVCSMKWSLSTCNAFLSHLIVAPWGSFKMDGENEGHEDIS